MAECLYKGDVKMTESEKKRRIDQIKKMVHQTLDVNLYNSSNVRNNTNCYSHAIGSTASCIELYRIGAICGKKPINQEYFSIEEIKHLLYEDLKVLELEIQESSEEELLNDNQYKIALFIKIYADNKIHDFHFLRYENGQWSEKRKTHFPINHGNTLKGLYSYWPWNLIGIFKITK